MHLNEKLAVKIHEIAQWGQYDDFSFKIGDKSLLKSVLDGKLDNSSTGCNDSYLWIFHPLGAGETTLTFSKNHWLSSEECAEFTINVVEQG